MQGLLLIPGVLPEKLVAVRKSRMGNNSIEKLLLVETERNGENSEIAW